MSNIAVAGAAGRMGRQLLSAIFERNDVSLGGATEHPSSDAIGTDAGLLVGSSSRGVKLVSDIAEVDSSFNTIVDFTSPGNTVALLRYAAENSKSMVIGTTGLSADDLDLMHKAAEQTAIVYASNYSVGVTLSLELLARAAVALGEEYDVEVVEAHHHHKVDAPSGTALSMGKAVADATGRDLDTCGVFSRVGITGAREKQSIGFSTIRGGDIIGEHTVMFCGQGERLEITHKATDRMTFARGAIRAAVWVSRQAPGLYDMKDVLKG
jgi:4-hydroxy-tetrahydrodipicolinate reductase